VAVELGPDPHHTSFARAAAGGNARHDVRDVVPPLPLVIGWPLSKVPTQITFGRHDVVTSTRVADAMKNGSGRSELTVFEGCAHAPIYESVAEFNEKTLSFLKRNSG